MSGMVTTTMLQIATKTIGLSGRNPMDFTLTRAGRTTHIKIVVIALVAAIAVVAVGINAQISSVPTARTAVDGVIKAGQPATYAGQELQTIR